MRCAYSRLQLDARPPAAETGSALVRVPRFSCSAGMAELLTIMAREMSFPNANNTLHCPNVVLQPVWDCTLLESFSIADRSKRKRCAFALELRAPRCACASSPCAIQDRDFGLRARAVWNAQS
ncbi:hypothetical protein ISCGN_001876 [Ixodes scapularis]